MVKGKDGFTALSVEEGAEEIVDEENGVLISMIVRQYFLSLKAVGKWRRGGAIRRFFGGLKRSMTGQGQLDENVKNDDDNEEDDLSDDEEDEDDDFVGAQHSSPEECRVKELTKKVALKWARMAGVKEYAHGEEYVVDWTRSVAPRVEGRIVKL